MKRIKNKIGFMLALIFSILTFSISAEAIKYIFTNRTSKHILFNPYVLRGLAGAMPALGGRALFKQEAEVIGEGTKEIIVKFASRIDLDNKEEQKRLVVPPKGVIELRFDDFGDAFLCLDPTNLWIRTYENGEFSAPKRAPLYVIPLENAVVRKKISEALSELAQSSEKIAALGEELSNDTVKEVVKASATVLDILPTIAKPFEDKRCREVQSYYLYDIAKEDRTGKRLLSNYQFIDFGEETKVPEVKEETKMKPATAEEEPTAAEPKQSATEEPKIEETVTITQEPAGDKGAEATVTATEETTEGI